MDPLKADLILQGGRVWTGLPGGNRPTAVAVAGGRIVAVGSDAEVAPLRGRGTRVVELEGRMLMPGFVDAHVHLMLGGLSLREVDLRGVLSREDFIRRLERAAQRVPPGEWITGGNWDHEAWGGEAPHRDWLDQAAPDHPVFLTRTDLHMAVTSSRGLERAGVGPHTPDPPGGEVDRDPATGEPTGLLRDAAMELVRALIPPPSPEERHRALVEACALALSRGITQLHDISDWDDLADYRRSRKAGRLPVRLYSILPIQDWKAVHALVQEEGQGDERLWWGGVKGFVDGSLGASTAWFHEPYADRPESRGLTLQDPELLAQWMAGAHGAGLHLVIHAIGDRAVEWLLDRFRELPPPRPRRPRMEHAQHLRPHLLSRFREQEVIASVQPLHALDDGRWIRDRLGEERLAMAYPLRSLHRHGARLAFGSDWTVAEMDPLGALRAAVTREDPLTGPPEEWAARERMEVEDALRAHTVGGAHAGFFDHCTGSLDVGKLADMVVLSHDLLELEPAAWGEVQVDTTYVEGEEVHVRSP